MHCVLMLLLFWLSSRGKVVSADQIKDVVAEYVHATSLVDPEDVAIEFRRLPVDLTASSEQYDLHVAADAHPVLRGNVTLPIEIVSDGVVDRRFMVSIRVRTFGVALFAARQLPQHSSAGVGDILEQRVETTTLPVDVVSSPDRLEGRRTTRIVSGGSVLRESMFEQIPVVSPHEPVNLIVRTKSVAVSVNAVAKEWGKMGDLVTVERPGIRGTLRGKVTGEKTVELKLN